MFLNSFMFAMFAMAICVNSRHHHEHHAHHAHATSDIQRFIMQEITEMRSEKAAQAQSIADNIYAAAAVNSSGSSGSSSPSSSSTTTTTTASTTTTTTTTTSTPAPTTTTTTTLAPTTTTTTPAPTALCACNWPTNLSDYCTQRNCYLTTNNNASSVICGDTGDFELVTDWQGDGDASSRCKIVFTAGGGTEIESSTPDTFANHVTCTGILLSWASDKGCIEF